MRQTGRVLAVCGMPMEAAIARGEGVETLCSAARPDVLRRKLADRLAAGGVVGLISFGIAGGLDDRHQPGSLVVAHWIAGHVGCWTTHEGWRRALLQVSPEAI